MKQNLGIADRLIRLIMGVALFNLSGSDIMPGSDNMICWVFATILLLNAALGFSLVYAFFGVRTISAKSKTYGNVLK
jgi:hypothetical protein